MNEQRIGKCPRCKAPWHTQHRIGWKHYHTLNGKETGILEVWECEMCRCQRRIVKPDEEK
jgi:hypothetical protein